MRAKGGTALLAGSTGLLLAVEPAAQESGRAVDTVFTGIVAGIKGIVLDGSPVLLDLLRDGGGGFAKIFCDLSKRAGSLQFRFDEDSVFQSQVLVLAHG